MSEPPNLPVPIQCGNSAIPLALQPGDLLAAVLSGRRAKTLAAYESDFRSFARFTGAASPGAALDGLVSLDHGAANGVVLAWRGEMTDRGLAPATIARRLAAVRSAIRVARMLGRCEFEIEVEPPKVQTLRDTAGSFCLPGERRARGGKISLARIPNPSVTMHQREHSQLRNPRKILKAR